MEGHYANDDIILMRRDQGHRLLTDKFFNEYLHEGPPNLVLAKKNPQYFLRYYGNRPPEFELKVMQSEMLAATAPELNKLQDALLKLRGDVEKTLSGFSDPETRQSLDQMKGRFEWLETQTRLVTDAFRAIDHDFSKINQSSADVWAAYQREKKRSDRRSRIAVCALFRAHVLQKTISGVGVCLQAWRLRTLQRREAKYLRFRFCRQLQLERRLEDMREMFKVWAVCTRYTRQARLVCSLALRKVVAQKPFYVLQQCWQQWEWRTKKNK